ncbi:bifunctional 4-hydroxy-2-oxoglutarate aldolase/2-dehydro-3-deoxy-phosphogluconate aldolase [Sanguibacter antarcticus]|uniref:2-dehydro-3-deoxyphosphogluconate aldolase/(4S)-4-hydroxy-2-oxoglutarate aldolase n=1 Tax=Sanguibacter antarcticus TaxID=372484 RepID=A0A2A9E4N5_9MICO|nr:bifunctional 4-hydroxy-2-oxoglutarate aldolase/2-dehydro-3-deoxy-phosphogluconate aldolase [Sanguibacter antarcticus]PFG33814.1 2-dehydro-3-deoxyphosphogluconate aldolase/(4S)-4-hydroxy-2-oxoglutarate aldolase [Sanguibacter antarcticus]
MSTEQQITEALEAARIVPVVVIDNPEHAVPLGRALLEGGLAIIEVTYRTAGAQAALTALKELPELIVGAGTVVRPDQVDSAAAAGAQFLVSPGLNVDVVRRAQAAGLPILPGVATPSDIMTALSLGLGTVKFFPAATLGGPSAIKAMSAPFPGLRFVPTGGISAATVGDYLTIPAVMAAGGSWMVDRALIEAEDWAEITRRTAEAVALAAQIGA